MSILKLELGTSSMPNMDAYLFNIGCIHSLLLIMSYKACYLAFIRLVLFSLVGCFTTFLATQIDCQPQPKECHQTSNSLYKYHGRYQATNVCGYVFLASVTGSTSNFGKQVFKTVMQFADSGLNSTKLHFPLSLWSTRVPGLHTRY